MTAMDLYVPVLGSGAMLFAFLLSGLYVLMRLAITHNAFINVGRNSLILIRDYWNYKFYLPLGLGERNLIKVSDKSCFKELSEAKELSQRAVYSDLFSFKETLHGHKGEEQNVGRARLFGRVLQVQGPRQLRVLSSHIDASIRNSFDRALEGGRTSGGATSLNLAALVDDTVFDIFSTYFFGPTLAQEAGFKIASRQHPRDLVNTLIVAKIVPKRIRGPLVNYITQGGKAGNEMRRWLVDIIKMDKQWKEEPSIKQSTMVASMLENTGSDEYWTAESLSQAIMGIWLAASFQPWVNLYFIVVRLCESPHYVQTLRQELHQQPEPPSVANVEDLPILDSFIKEVFRTRPLDHLSVRRKSLRPFTFSNGQHVAMGQVACIPSIERMQDSSAYPEPQSFNGLRFVKQNHARLTDVSEDFLSWGFGSLACPGRFLASSVMKIVVVHLLTNYDLELEHKSGAALSWMWESFEMPSKKTRILLRPQESS